MSATHFFQAKVISRLIYAAPAWWGLASKQDIHRIDSFLNKSKRFKLYPEDGPMFEEMCRKSDKNLFNKIRLNQNHVLFKLLPAEKNIKYNLKKITQFCFTL